MKGMKRILKRAGAVLASGVLSLTAFAGIGPQSLVYAADCVVDTGKKYQVIEGFGGINLPEWAGSDMTEAQVQKAFGNGQDELGFTILRIYVSDNSNDWSKAIPTAKRAQALGATIFASPWNPPASIRNTVNGGLSGGKYQLKSDKWKEYAEHLNSFVKYVEGQGINLYSISVQNEPDYAEDWTYWSANDVAKFIAQYGQTVKAGTKAKLMSAESFQYQKAIYDAIIGNADAMKNCDLFGTHFYGTQRGQMDYAKVENSGKQIWMTEVYVPNSHADSADIWSEAIQVSENIHNGLVVGNMSAYVWWFIRRSYSPMKENGQISKRGYNMAQYSKWIRPGARRVDATEQPNTNILCSAYQNEDGSIAIVAINKGSGQVNQTFSLSNEQVSSIQAYRTSANENIKEISVNGSGKSFTAALPASSVTTFVIGAKEEEPDPDGYLFHDTFEGTTNGWSGRGSASADTSTKEAFEGSGSLLTTGREAVWNGAIRNLPTSKFKAGTEYSFSAVVQNAGSTAGTFHLTLQYTGSDSEAHYEKIDTQTLAPGQWTQLANTNFKIPADAVDPMIYVETEDVQNDFYLDEVIGAPAGTVIEGPKAIEFKRGDLNGDGKITATDFTLAKRGILAGKFADAVQQLAADVTADGAVGVADAVWYAKYLIGEITDFGKVPGSTADPGTTIDPGTSTDDPPASGNTPRPLSVYSPIVQNQLSEYEDENARKRQNGVQYGTLVDKKYYSEFCRREKPYVVLLPAGYSESKKYPVLYVMHGYYENQDRMCRVGNDTTMGMTTVEIVGNAIASGAAEDMIVVFPYIYSSQTQNDCSGMNDANNLAYDNFETVLVNELMPLIEKEYSVKTGKNNTAITGFSMGGRESLRIGLMHPDKFGYVGSICAAPGVPDIKWSSDEAAPYLLLMTAGDNDQTVYNGPVDYHNNAERLGTPHAWHYIRGGYHGDNCIRSHIYNFIRVIFKA